MKNFLNIYAKSDIGKVRSSNQDCYEFKVADDELAWALICDGMGGTDFGGVASEIAKEVISKGFEESFSSNRRSFSYKNMEKIIVNLISDANKKIFEKSQEKPFSEMGTTVVCAIVFRESLYVAHVGDSRAYIVSNTYIKQITEDHSVVQEMVKSGKITPSQARSSSQKNVITRALGIESSVKVDCAKFSLSEGDNILLCTDGLTNYVDEKILGDYFRKFEIKNQNLVSALVDEANNKGGKDNITVLLITRVGANNTYSASGGCR